MANQKETPANLSPLIVVSGFPRTGTSTMMRMLYLGGMSVIAEEDHQQGRHEFDPYGDYELVGENLKKFKERSPESTAGKAVKIISPLVPELCPTDRPVRVIFMLRDHNEIVASLLAMRVVWEWTPGEANDYASRFFKHHEIPVMYVQYKDMFNYPISTAHQVEEWVNPGNMDVSDMKHAVDRNARTKIKGEGGQDRLLTYRFDKALVDDRFEVDLRKEESD